MPLSPISSSVAPDRYGINNYKYLTSITYGVVLIVYIVVIVVVVVFLFVYLVVVFR